MRTDCKKGYIYIDDAIDALICAMDSNSGNGMVFNLGIREPATILEIANGIISKVNKDIKVEATGKFRTGDTRHSWPDIDLIENTYPWTPKYKFEDGLIKLIDWFKTIPKNKVLASVKNFEIAENYAKSFGLEV